MKNSALRRALVVPVVLVVGLGGTALVASPAFAAEPAAATPTATAAPSATATPTATPAPAAKKAAPAPAAAAAPKDLVLTSPTLDEDGTAEVHGPRVVTLAGQAPVGSVLHVSNGEGKVIETVTTTTADFSIPLTFTADDGYDQFLSLFGKIGAKELTEIDFDVVFDAETSATPTITSPASGTAYRTIPAPFTDGQPNAYVEFSGTGTPGDQISLYSDSETGFGSGFSSSGQYDDITVGDDGTWTGDYYVGFGTDKVSAVQALYNDDEEQLTVESEQTPDVSLTVDPVAGTILPPLVTSPNYDGLSFSAGVDPGDGSIFIASFGPAVSLAQNGPATLSKQPQARAARPLAAQPRTQAAKVAATTTRTRALAEKRTVATPVEASTEAKVKTLLGLSGIADKVEPKAGDGAFQTLDQVTDEYGIPVTGTPSPTTVGDVDMTVSGTGTPGDGVVLYEEKVDPAFSYLQGLYPSLFGNGGPSAPLNPVATKPLARAAVATGDPEATSELPAFDGTIHVGADGKWTATLSRVPGNYLLVAFAVNGDGTKTADYSVASAASLIHLTGTPSVAAAAAADPTELAFTGSNSGPALAVGFGALAAGAALLVAARRRRLR